MNEAPSTSRAAAPLFTEKTFYLEEFYGKSLLFALVPPGQILYGSDMPYGSALFCGLSTLRVGLANPEAGAFVGRARDRGMNLREHRLLFIQHRVKDRVLSDNNAFGGPRLIGNMLRYHLFKSGVMARRAISFLM